MAVEVVVPGLGLGWSSGRIVHWYRPDGSQVSRGEPVFCLETDFVTIDVEADADGIVRHRPHEAEAIEAGAVAALILAPGERLPEEPTDAPEAAWDEPAAEAAPIPAAPVRRYAFERWEAVPTIEDDGEPADDSFDFATALPSSLDETPAEEAHDDVPPPPSILPLRRNTLPPPPPIATDSPWAPVPGDEVAVAGAWNQAPEEAADDSASLDRWAVGEPPVKHPEEDPRAYFGVAPFARGVTELRPDGPASETIDDGATPLPALDRAGDAPLPAAAPPAALTMRTLVDMREARKMRAQLTREWRTLEPSDEDVILRAAGRALREAGQDGAIALTVPGEDAATVTTGATTGGFREAVESLRAGGGAGGGAGCTVTTFAHYGIDEAAPALAEAQVYAIAAGAVREFAVIDGDRAVAVPMLTLVVAYDPARTTAGRAAALLGRIRELLEAPYALLAA